MTKTHKHTLFSEIPWGDPDKGMDAKIEVIYSYYAGCRGSCDRYGVPQEPDDEPELEILSVKHYCPGNVSHGEVIDYETLPEKDYDKLRQQCFEDVASSNTNHDEP